MRPRRRATIEAIPYRMVPIFFPEIVAVACWQLLVWPQPQHLTPLEKIFWRCIGFAASPCCSFISVMTLDALLFGLPYGDHGVRPAMRQVRDGI
jgi:hypothetical protein